MSAADAARLLAAVAAEIAAAGEGCRRLQEAAATLVATHPGPAPGEARALQEIDLLTQTLDDLAALLARLAAAPGDSAAAVAGVRLHSLAARLRGEAEAAPEEDDFFDPSRPPVPPDGAGALSLRSPS